MEARRAIVVGAGQTPGETMGNGRAISLQLAREGATVLAVDRDLDSAAETAEMIRAAGGDATVLAADVTEEADCARIAEHAADLWPHIDVLVNNVGIGTGDTGASRLSVEAWDRIHHTNLRGTWLTCKHVLPLMRARGSGAVVNVSSIAAVCSIDLIAYKTSKAGVNALTQQLAASSARRGVRVNAVMPGLMDTPMAIESTLEATGADRDELRQIRDSLVPLGQKMGTAADVANAVVFLASDEASFITGAILPVDGGQHCRVG